MEKGNYALNKMFLDNESKFAFDETVSILSEKIQLTGWKVLMVHDLKDILHKKGKEVLPVKILEVCNSTYSGEMLETDSFRVYSPLLPCRLSVYEKNDGKVFISRMNLKVVASPASEKAEAIMTKAFTDIEKVLEEIIVKQ